MSMEPTISIEIRKFRNNEYLYIYKDDPNIVNYDNRISWVYIELDGFYMKKSGKNLTLGNYTGEMYTITGYTSQMLNNWVQKIRNVTLFP